MSESKLPPPAADDADIEREIRRGRKFSMGDAIGRMGGEGMLKGASPVPPIEQTTAAISNYLKAHLDDNGGVLAHVLLRHVKTSTLLIDHFDQPAVVLAAFVDQALKSDTLLKELVREADVEWARALGERPYFERDGRAPNPDDPYTLTSVRTALTQLVDKAARAPNGSSSE